MKNSKHLSIKSLIHKEFKFTFIVTILFIETMLLLLYFGVNYYTTYNTKKLLVSEVKENLNQISVREAKNINYQMKSINDIAVFLQKEEQNFFENPKMTDMSKKALHFKKAPNGIFYKTEDNNGSSVCFLNVKKIKIGKKEIQKAIKTEAFDLSFKNFTQSNPNIVAVYLNTYDSMNRYYPFIKDVYSQYDPIMDIPHFNFYYEADLKHNSSKKPVWTDVYLDPAGKGWMASCIVPVYNKTFLEGVVGIDLTINAFVENILSLNLPWDAEAFLIDSKGTILAMPEKLELLFGLKELKKHTYTNSIKNDTFKPEDFNILKSKNPIFSKTIKEIYTGKKNLSELMINGKEYILSQQIIKETGWRFLVIVEKDNIFKPIYSFKQKTQKLGLLSIFYIFILYAVLFYYITRKTKEISDMISQPILSLSDKTSLILSGEDIEIPSCGVEEIDDMSHNFNVMTEKLRKLYENLNKDIETRKQIQTELINSMELAQAADKVKSEFLSNMSHEIRTPLTSIIGYLGLLSGLTNLDKEQSNYVNNAEKSSRMLLCLVNDILDFSKIEAGKLDIESVDFNLMSTIEDIVNLAKQSIRQKNIMIKTDIGSDVPEQVCGDSVRLAQILNNLVSNAVKFTEEGEIIISVKKTQETQDFTELTFEIKDTGIGIPKEKQEVVFDVFIQADASTTRKFGGTGLGLAISKKLVNLMDGEISVESKIGEGTTFSFSIRFNK